MSSIRRLRRPSTGPLDNTADGAKDALLLAAATGLAPVDWNRCSQEFARARER